eukprot:9570926-Prorocentrum_lima.AAC.1
MALVPELLSALMPMETFSANGKTHCKSGTHGFKEEDNPKKHPQEGDGITHTPGGGCHAEGGLVLQEAALGAACENERR